MSKERKHLGHQGESQAVDFLVSKGFQVLSRNIDLDFGEIDILALDQDGTLVIVEVKTKQSTDTAEPHESVNAAKQRQLIRLAKAMEAQYPDRPIRIDVISIVDDKIEHFPNAVWQK